MNPLTTESQDDFVIAVSYCYHRTTYKPEIEREHLSLNGATLATYLICSSLACIRSSGCRFTLTAELVSKMTGYSVRQARRALISLQETTHIVRIGVDGLYELGCPVTKTVLAAGKKFGLRTLLATRQLAYLKIPRSLLDRLPGMSGVALQATIALLQATWNTPKLTFDASEWAERANISNTRDLYKIIESLDWLAEIERSKKSISISMKNPVTGKLLVDEEYERAEREMADRIAERVDPKLPYTPEVLKAWISSLIPISYEHDGGEMRIHCPVCRNALPTLSISPNIGEYGVFHCIRCGYGKHKHVPHLLDELGLDAADYFKKLEQINERMKQ